MTPEVMKDVVVVLYDEVAGPYTEKLLAWLEPHMEYTTVIKNPKHGLLEMDRRHIGNQIYYKGAYLGYTLEHLRHHVDTDAYMAERREAMEAERKKLEEKMKQQDEARIARRQRVAKNQPAVADMVPDNAWLNQIVGMQANVAGVRLFDI